MYKDMWNISIQTSQGVVIFDPLVNIADYNIKTYYHISRLTLFRDVILNND